MKKYLLKSFALLAMLFSAITMSAKQYCHEPLTLSGGATIYLSCELISEGQYRITIEGENLKGLGGSFYDPGAVDLRKAITTKTETKIVCDIAATSAPTLYTPLYVLCPGEQNIGWPNDIDWTGTCGEGGGETGVPVLENVELFGSAQNFVLLTPTATDDKGVTSYLIAQSGGKESEVTPDATTGQIKIASLTLGKEYTYIVKAKDKDGNVSNAKEITFSTLDDVFCEEEVLPGTAQEFANQKLTFTAKKVSDTETYFAISSSTSTLTKISSVTFYNNTGETGTYGGGVLPEGYVLKDGWTLTDNTLSKTVTWTTYPTAPFRASINATRKKNSDTEKTTINWMYTMDLSNTCGEAPSPAPVPTVPAEQVFSIYSNAYTSAVNRTMGYWNQTTQEQEVQLAEGDKAFYYTNCNYLGWELNDTYDMTAYPMLHMDVYVVEAGSIGFTPIWGGEAEKAYVLQAGWNAIDIDLATDFAAINLATIDQLKWANMPATCYIDNVYFFNDGTTEPVEPTPVESNYCQKTLTKEANSIDLTCEKVSVGNYRIIIEGSNLGQNGMDNATSGSFIIVNNEKTENITKSSQLKQYINTTLSTTSKVICEVPSTVDPKFDGNLYIMMPGEVNFGAVSDVIWGTCPEAEEDDQAPTMTSATVESYTHNSAVIAVEAEDNIGVVKYHIVDANNGIDEMLTATAGKITLANLSSATTYNLTISAIDKVGNESTGRTVTAFTTDALLYCDFPTGHESNAAFGDVNGRILVSAIKVTPKKIRLLIKSAAEATKNIDLVYVAPVGAAAVTVGSDVAEGGSREVAVDIEYATAPATYGFMIQWSNPNWPGRWQASINNILPSQLCTEPVEVYDVNFALAENGSTAEAKSEKQGASRAIDGDEHTQWESEHNVDPQTWILDLGQERIFNTIDILWEGAYAKDFTVSTSSDKATWAPVWTVEDQTLSSFPYTQTQTIDKTTARYVKFEGTERGTVYGYSFYEFRVYLAGESVLTTLEASVSSCLLNQNGSTNINLVAKNQNGVVMDIVDHVTYTVTPADAGSITDNVFTATSKTGRATIVASIGGIQSDPVEIYTYGNEVAPVPTRDADDVIAFYSDTYTPAINLWGKRQWNNNTVWAENTVSENTYLHYSGGNWWGWEFGVNEGANKEGVSSGVDCSEMEYLHIDVWGFENGTIRVIPIWGGTDLVENKALTTNDRYYAVVEIKPNQWNSVDIPLATGFQPAAEVHDFSSIFQFKFAECTTTAIAIDNVYFWKPAGNLPVESVTLDKTVATIEVEETLQLNDTVLPVEAANKNVVWTSSSDAIATVVDGLVTALSAGEVTITATSEYNGEIKATCTITVEPITEKTWWGDPTTIKIEGVDVAILYSYTRNEDKTITYSVIFDNPASALRADINVNLGGYNLMHNDGTGNNTAIWTSTTTHSKGETIIGFWYIAGNRIDFSYIVGSSNERPTITVESVTLDKTTCDLMPNETAQLVATVNPGYVDNKNVDWTSSNTAVATVDANGLVTAVAAGSATITATSVADNTKTATCTVNVMAELTDATYYANAFFIENGRYVGFNYSITRTTERKLHYEATVNGNVVGLVVEINDGNWHGMVYDADSKSYSYTTDNTYADGITTINHFFYVKFAGGAQEVDADYTVGSANLSVPTMVAINESDEAANTALTGNIDAVIGRAFTNAYWQTISLPFTLDQEQLKEVFGNGVQVAKLNSSRVASTDNATFELNFEYVSEIEAATPYLIRPSKEVAKGAVIRDVLVDLTPKNVLTTDATMIPVLFKTTFPTAVTNYWLAENGYLYGGATDIEAMRAYFTFPNLTAEQASRMRARVVFNENTETSVDNITIDESAVKVIQNGQLIIIRNGEKYNVQGQKL